MEDKLNELQEKYNLLKLENEKLIASEHAEKSKAKYWMEENEKIKVRISREEQLVLENEKLRKLINSKDREIECLTKELKETELEAKERLKEKIKEFIDIMFE